MKVAWSSPALDDLRRIDGWLVREASPEIAVRTLSAIRLRAEILVDFPRSGRPHLADERVLRVYGTPYVIRYGIADDRVEVIRVHHEREDWSFGS